ncbi:hypothetical protein Tco_0128279 [Tanacetum coccineum]
MRKGLLDPNGGRCGGKGRRGGSMARSGEGWLTERSIESNDSRGGGGVVVHGGKSLRELKNRRDGASGGEVNGRGVVLGMFKSLLGEIPSDMMGERGGGTMGLDGGAVWFVKFLKGMGEGMFRTR